MSIEKAKPNSNVRLRFDQSSPLHSEYLYFLYDLFKDYTLSPPKSTNRKPDKRTGKTYNSLIFKTRMLPCFNYLWELFYAANVKVVPQNIGELFTSSALAFWIMDDGGLGFNGELNLHTHSYTLEEVERLRLIKAWLRPLNDNFKIYSRKAFKRPGQWMIVIPKRELPTLVTLTIPHMHPSMWYKLGKSL